MVDLLAADSSSSSSTWPSTERNVVCASWLNRLDRRPRRITVDNGRKFVSQILDQWAHGHKIQADFIRPGKPVENEYIESFHGRLHEACLNANWFASLEDSRAAIEAWRQEYNARRPHGALGGPSPQEFLWARGLNPSTDSAGIPALSMDRRSGARQSVRFYLSRWIGSVGAGHRMNARR
jgi:transposase InsO family protein